MTTIGHSTRATGDAVRDRDRDVTHLPAVLKRTTWGAVFAGALAAIGLQMILTVLGVALGVSTIDASNTAEGVGAMAGLWWLITGTLSLIVGGAVVGRLAGIPKSIDVVLHGFAMWAVTAVFGFMVLWSTAGLATTAGANAAGALGAANRWDPAQIARGVQSAAPVVGDPQNAANTTGASQNAANTGNAGNDTILARPNDADVQQARDAAQAASWWTLGGLLLGVSAATIASWAAAPNRILVRPPIEG